MSARDRYSVDLKCPHCGSTGTADISENDHAYAPPEARVEGIRGGFRLSENPHRNITSMKFKCTLCGVEAV